VVGSTNAANDGRTFVRKYDARGQEVWTRQLEGSEAFAVTLDRDGDVYVAGRTYVALPGQTAIGDTDLFVRKYDARGQEVWTRQFGTPGTDIAFDVAVDQGGSIYVAGAVGLTSTGGGDVFLSRHSQNGVEQWRRQFGGTAGYDWANAVATDQMGGVYIAGRTTGALPGETASGSYDAFVRKYDTHGRVIWTHQFGSPSGSGEAYGVAVERPGGRRGPNGADGEDQGENAAEGARRREHPTRAIYVAGTISACTGVACTSDAFVAKLFPPVSRPNR